MKQLESKKPLSVCTFYQYQSLEHLDLHQLRGFLNKKGELEGLRGLILISKQGINATLVGSIKHLKRYLQMIRDYTQLPLQGQWQISNTWGFKKLRVKIKDEILKLNQSPHSHDTHLTPSQWHSKVQEEETILLDLRNDYEVALGRFKGAKDLHLDQFKNLPQRLKKSNIPKDKNVLIYCTGGIRCEKAVNEMKEQGWNHVSQLKGGIMSYLQEYPNAHFKGDCFVFDHRVSLNQKLNPSKKYHLCPHCGNPGKQPISCLQCQIQAVVCSRCYDQDKQTCSKNCSYHYQKGHKNKSAYKFK